MCRLNTPATFDQTKDLSRALAQDFEREHPDLVTSNMSKDVRKGKVFVDWSQNDEHKTTDLRLFATRKGRTDCFHASHLGGG